MVGRTPDWKEELGTLSQALSGSVGSQGTAPNVCPLYVSGLIGPGDRKSIAPMAKRLALGECDQLVGGGFINGLGHTASINSSSEVNAARTGTRIPSSIKAPPAISRSHPAVS